MLLALIVFSAAHGLAPACADLGWAPRKVAQGAPASVDFSGGEGWMVGCELHERTATVRLKARGGEPLGGVLQLQLDADGVPGLPRVLIGPFLSPDGAVASIPVGVLNPGRAAFSRIVLRAARPIASGPVLIDELELVPGAEAPAPAPVAPPPRAKPRPHSGKAPPPEPAAPAPKAAAPEPAPQAAPSAPARASGPSRAASFTVRCDRPGHPISPDIYGVAQESNDVAWQLSARARRWGGNTTTRYSWQPGNAWNTGSDWFFMNTTAPSWRTFLEENAAHGARSAVTLPMIGWVAKDTAAWSFSVGALGPQRGVAPENHDAGNGIALDGTPLPSPPPARTSIAAPPAFIAQWVKAMRAARPGERRVYILDNEPNLWSSTHRDVHPEPLSYDELLQRTLDYGSAVRAADPDALIAGFAEWGWSNYFWSAKDLKSKLRTDRLAHGGTALLPWWLRNVREREKATGKRLIDLLDVHFYPQAQGVGAGRAGGTDPETAARRIRSTRALWDPAYVDESWIAEPVRLIPRLREWIAAEHPGLKIQIGEWNFGAEEHQSAALATAEVLGRFGALGVDAAYYFSTPKLRSPAFWGFRAFTNYDGKGARFLDQSAPVEGDPPLASLFASRQGDEAVLVLLNHDPSRALAASIDVASCGTVASAEAFVYAGGSDGYGPGIKPVSDKAALRLAAPPYAVEVVRLRLH